MVDLQAYLETKLREIISSWHDDEAFAISFFVYANETYRYKSYTNVTEFSVSYRKESDCCGADEFSEKRWDYAFWSRNEIPVIAAEDENEGAKILFDWYEENGVENIGYEDYSACYDDEMKYIGKGPVGYYELLSEITTVARKLQESGWIQSQFGRSIPIIIHDLDYSWYTIEATRRINRNGEADAFLAAMKKLGYTD